MNRDLHHTMTAQYAAPKVSGNGVVRWDGGVKCVLPSVKLCGAAAQDGTPTPDAPVMPVCNDGVFQAHGDTILGTTKLNTLDFGWRKNTDNEFGMTDAYSYYEIQAKPNATYCFIAPYGVFGQSEGFTFLCNNRAGSNRAPIYRSSKPEQCHTFGKIITDDTGMLYIVSTGFTSTLNVTRAFWLTEWDGGQAAAPELWAVPGTEYMDEWDAQTGRGVRRCAVIGSYSGEQITTPYISSTGELSEGAMVVYGIPDKPFAAEPARLVQPNGPGQITQVSGAVPGCPIEAAYLTHS